MNIFISIVQVCGVAFLIGFVLSLVNFFFGLRLGLRGAEVPGEPAAAVFFLVIGCVFVIAGRFLDRKFGS